jgi:hypothetical protein
MKHKTSTRLACASVFLGGSLVANSATTAVTFEDLACPAESYWNGSDGSGKFSSGGAEFLNSYNSDYQSWSGFAFSSSTDTATPGYGNQYSAYPGRGMAGSSTYAVAYGDAVVKLSSPLALGGLGASFANTTYAALVILNGDSMFGTSAFAAGDWFKLTIRGYQAGLPTGAVESYLADYRSGSMLVNDWQHVDFSALGTVDELRFGLSSSDNSEFGGFSYMNTPAYFAMDNLFAVPEPGTMLLLASGGLGLLLRRRR